jgi:hypothetical protein
MPDGFIPPMAYHPQILEGGYTRLEISCPPDRLAVLHRKLVEELTGPLKVRYVQMASRKSGQNPKPVSYVGVEISQNRLQQALAAYTELLYHDGRCQIWVLGSREEQLVLDDIGMIYIYPDDPAFRTVLDELGWKEMGHQSMASRDYVRVNFVREADEQEQSLIQSLGLVQYDQ